MEFLNEEFLEVTFRLIACRDLLRSLLIADLRRQVSSDWGSRDRWARRGSALGS